MIMFVFMCMLMCRRVTVVCGIFGLRVLSRNMFFVRMCRGLSGAGDGVIVIICLLLVAVLTL